MGRVGNYDTFETVGSGSFSQVKRVRERTTGEMRVAKVVSKSEASAERHVDVEVCALSRLRHSKVIGLKEVLHSQKHFYIILELASGGDLCELILGANKTGLANGQLRSIFAQIVEGLIACHAAGVAHRDLKPENVLLTDKGEAKISDFGLSHVRASSILPEDDYAVRPVGTLAYAAPEVLSGRYDPFRADIWSLGCLLYVMATGCFPYPIHDHTQHTKQLSQPHIALPKGTSSDLCDLVGRLLTFDPANRITLVDVLKHPFVSGPAEERKDGYTAQSAASSRPVRLQ